MTDDLFKLCVTLIIFALAIGAVVTVAYFFYQLLDLGEQRPKPRRKTARSIAVNRRAPYKVLLLLHDDHAVADRLFAHVRGMNPKQSEKWCWDKVLWDLERDRH